MIVLVAEDEAITALLLDTALRAAGHQVLGPAATAKEALELAEHTKPDLALLDIQPASGDPVPGGRCRPIGQAWQQGET
jgi:CheY-like chemotaxis protein